MVIFVMTVQVNVHANDAMPNMWLLKDLHSVYFQLNTVNGQGHINH